MATSPNSPTATWTRRRILGWGGAGAAGSFVAYMTWPSHQTAPATTAKPPTLPTASSPTAATALAQAMSREDFLPHLHSSFRLEAGVACTLVEVSAAQNALNAQGFSLKIDGMNGKRTAEALKGFQIKQGLQATGELDDATRAALGLAR